MKFTDLKNDIAQGAGKIYLLEGEDAYFRQKGEEMIKSAFLTMAELNFSSFDGESLKGSQLTALVSALKNYPFMAEKRIVKVSEFYPTEQEFSTYLSPLFSDFPETSILIIVNTGGKKGVDLKRKKPVTYVDCGKAEPETVARWVYLTLKRAKIAAPVAVCESIAAYCLYNMSRVSCEVQKLIDYKGEGELTQAEVDGLVFKDADYRVYELSNAVASKNYDRFCVICEDLRGKGLDETAVLNGLFSFFRNLLSAASSPLSDGAYAAENNLKEYAVRRMREQARAIGEENLKGYAGLCYGNISAIKSGKLTPQSAFLLCRSAIFFGGK